MDITVNQSGNFQFNEDLSGWAKKFLNGQNMWLDVAGSTKMRVEYEDSFTINDLQDDVNGNSNDQVVILREIRKRIKSKFCSDIPIGYLQVRLYWPGSIIVEEIGTSHLEIDSHLRLPTTFL